MQQKKDLPIGISCVQKVFKANEVTKKENIWSQAFILCMTFLIYTCYHLSRKPLSVVKNVFTRNCSTVVNVTDDVYGSSSNTSINPHNCHWAPFDGPDSNSLLGLMDFAFLFAYAFSMFVSGFIAERMNLRYFLSFGMIASGIVCHLLGFAYFYNIHSLWYFIVIQIIGGIFQSTGWPAVVAVMGNWFGEKKNGIIFGIWNSHTSVGNILGTLIASWFVETDWALSFIIPGAIMILMGVLCFLFLMTEPVQNRHVQRTPQGPAFMDNANGNRFYQIPPEPVDTTGVSSDNSASTDETNNDAREIRPEVRPILSGNSAKAVGFIEAFKTPGVIEFSLCLFFAKLVSNTFLYWLPYFIKNSTTFGASKSADISTLFDVGGIVGGIIAGALSDSTGMSASPCCFMLLFSIPLLYIYYVSSSSCFILSISLLMFTGAFVNGPYSLITTAVSAKLGMEGDKKSISTITSIIDGTGSIGAAVGPLLVGLISNNYGWEYVFYILMVSNAIAVLMLVRISENELSAFIRRYSRGWTS